MPRKPLSFHAETAKTVGSWSYISQRQQHDDNNTMTTAQHHQSLHLETQIRRPIADCAMCRLSK